MELAKLALVILFMALTIPVDSLSIGQIEAGLNPYYYYESCPTLEKTVFDLVKALVEEDITLPAAWLRLEFHDCFVHGCDASVLINNTDPNTELSSRANVNSLRLLDVFETVKTAVEAQCPETVSCADILALATRDAVEVAGGPHWEVHFGRRDGLISRAVDADRALPSPFSNFSTLVQNFAAVGLDARDMVVLSGAHTIGFTHCSIIRSRLYNFPGSPDGIDPTLNKDYARFLQTLCPPSGANSRQILMDPSNGGLFFDSNYYVNVLQNRGLFISDAALLTDPQSFVTVTEEAASTAIPFFMDFALAMEKMIKINVLTGAQGEIRKKCSDFNH